MTCVWVVGRFVGAVGAVGAVGSVLRLVCGLQAFTASRIVLMACGVPGSGGGAAVWSVVLSRSRSRATGLRAQGQARCLRRRLRGERPRSEGWPGHCPARVLLVVPARIPRRVVVAVGSTTTG